MFDPIAWFKDRERYGVVIIGTETGNVYDLPFARFRTIGRAQGFVDNMEQWQTPSTEYRVVDRRDPDYIQQLQVRVPEVSLFEPPS
jgi:hypothetical protein